MRETILKNLDKVKDLEAALSEFKATAQRLLDEAKADNNHLLVIHLEEVIEICDTLIQDVESLKVKS